MITNACFPFSVLVALGMVYEGLGGSTRANVASSLGFPEDEQRFRDGFKVETIIQLSHLFHF